jgi:nucleoside triphosphate diphosphatase
MADSPSRDADHPGLEAFPPSDGHLDRALTVVETLRRHCAWDRKQTAESLVPHLLEEAHETAEAVAAGDPGALVGELGDLLLNVAFQVVVAEETGRFTRDDVIDGLETKMVRRHPHVFVSGDASVDATATDPHGRPAGWEAMKARERAAAGGEGAPASILASLPRGLDPLLRAHRMQQKAAGVGFDWEGPEGALDKLREEIDEVAIALDAGDPNPLREEIGDLLFSVVNLARLAGVHAFTALEAANVKFERRFAGVERHARDRGIPMPGAPLEALDALWDEVKAGEMTVEEDGSGAPGSGA